METDNKVQIECPICGEISLRRSFPECYRVECPICKIYNIGDSFNFPEFTDEEKIKLRYFYFTLPEKDERRLKSINSENKELIIAKIISPKTLLEKVDYVMEYIYKKTKYFGQSVSFNTINDYRRFFCVIDFEFYNILKHLSQKGYINKIKEERRVQGVTLPDRKITITADGLGYAEKLYNRNESKQCFVAMWFDDSTDDLYEKIEKAITGNPKLDNDDVNFGANYEIRRIDDKHHINYIPAEIISEIKRSKFMIADLTGNRGGVYYEAGFAEGIGIPVILTCREDELEKVHFDLKQKNILTWTNDKLEIFQRNLVARIGEIVGFNINP